jgi:hypothetical protein
MTDDPTPPPDIKAIWKDQPLEIPPLVVAAVRRKARRLQQRRLWIMIRETVAALVLVAISGLYIRLVSIQGVLELYDAMIGAGMGLMILFAVFYGWRILVLFRPRRLPDDTVACLDFHRRELERQRDLVRGAWRWVLVPLVPIWSLLLIGRWIGASAGGHARWLDHLTILASAVFMLENCFLMWLWNQHRADRWQDQIDELDALGQEETR